MCLCVSVGKCFEGSYIEKFIRVIREAGRKREKGKREATSELIGKRLVEKGATDENCVLSVLSHPSSPVLCPFFSMLWDRYSCLV